jgi:hypothetical protein
MQKLLIIACLWSSACLSLEVAEEVPMCERAAHHMADCMGELPPSEVATCDPLVAQQVLSLGCDQLSANTTDTKADGFSSAFAAFACRIGLYRSCEVPMCVPGEDEGPAAPTARASPGASQCAIDALAFEGCGACDYYLCREQEMGCGPNGYFVGFGYHYCNAFRLVTEAHVSPEAQAWLVRVRRCLIESMDSAPFEGDCDAVRTQAYASHEACYVETGFCDLSVGDWLRVLNTVRLSDLDFQQMFVTAKACYGGE